MELSNPGSGAGAVHTASHSAQTALNNNFLPCAVMLASMAWSAYKTYDTACAFGEYWEAYMTDGVDAVVAKAGQDGAMRLIFGGAFKVGGDVVMKVGGKLYRFCPEGVQALGEQGYQQVYKAVKKVEEHAFFKQTVREEQRVFGREASHRSQTTREKLFWTNDVATSRGDRVRQINGQRPRNHEYAGQTFSFDKINLERKLQGVSDSRKRQELTDTFDHFNRVYPHGVPFTGTGHPDFSRYATKKVEIPFSGKSGQDIRQANKLMGWKEEPSGFTWHHHHDGKTLMLIDTQLHDTVKHTGGSAITRNVGGRK